MKTIFDVLSAYKNNEYTIQEEKPSSRKLPENHVFDEDMSVKWNCEEVVKYNEELVTKLTDYRKRSNLMLLLMMNL